MSTLDHCFPGEESLYMLEVEQLEHKKKFSLENFSTFIFISSKVGSVGVVQQDIKLVWPKGNSSTTFMDHQTQDMPKCLPK